MNMILGVIAHAHAAAWPYSKLRARVAKCPFGLGAGKSTHARRA
jgi:hypothetical protein